MSTITLAGKPVGPIGFGLMGFTWRPTPTPEAQAFSTLNAAIASGSTFWNAGEFYGPPTDSTANLSLLSRYFAAHPNPSVVLSVKGGVNLATLTPDGSPDGVRRSVENVLDILAGTKFVDIFQCARVDRTVPIETTIGVLAEYVRAGRIGGIGLSEAGPDTIRRAHAVHPIAAVEVEVSPISRDIFEAGGVADTCAELGIPVVAYSPLGRGFLAGKFYKSWEEIPEGDNRKIIDRFKPDFFEKNMEITRALKVVADRCGVTPAQLCIAWVRAQGTERGLTIIPIPGATTVEKLEENNAVVEVGAEDLKEVDAIVDRIGVVGLRYNEHLASGLLV